MGASHRGSAWASHLAQRPNSKQHSTKQPEMQIHLSVSYFATSRISTHRPRGPYPFSPSKNASSCVRKLFSLPVDGSRRSWNRTKCRYSSARRERGRKGGREEGEQHAEGDRAARRGRVSGAPHGASEPKRPVPYLRGHCEHRTDQPTSKWERQPTRATSHPNEGDRGTE